MRRPWPPLRRNCSPNTWRADGASTMRRAPLSTSRRRRPGRRSARLGSRRGPRRLPRVRRRRRRRPRPGMRRRRRRPRRHRAPDRFRARRSFSARNRRRSSDPGTRGTLSFVRRRGRGAAALSPWHRTSPATDVAGLPAAAVGERCHGRERRPFTSLDKINNGRFFAQWDRGRRAG